MWVSTRISKDANSSFFFKRHTHRRLVWQSVPPFGALPEQKTRNSVRALRSNNDYAKVECRLQANARMFARDVRALRVKSYAFDPFESVYIARKENLSNKIFLRLGLNRSKCTEKEISKRALRTSARLATMPFAR